MHTACGENPRVLLVDDDEGIRTAVSAILRVAGYSVVQAENGETCLERLKAGFRGLVLMDVIMPGMTGWETIRAMNEAGLLEGNIICMLTGILEPGEKADGLEEFVFDYLAKPFETTDLLAVVKHAGQYLAA